MLCVECSYPVSSLYTYYSQDNIRATTCNNCGKFADKYIEYDSVLVGLDLLLLRPQAIRHLIFNVLLPSKESKVITQTWRIHVIITLFDVYIHWAWAEKGSDPLMQQFLEATPAHKLYTAFLVLCTANTLVVHAATFLSSRLIVKDSNPEALAIAILISSYAKLLPLLTLIWQYEYSQVLSLVWYVVGIVLIEVLAEALNFGYIRAVIITSFALGLRWYICHDVLWPLLTQ